MATEINIGDRRLRAAELLSLKGFVSLAELVQELGVSESTVRRDLELLEEQSLIRRTHGGAVSVQNTPALADRRTSAAAEKKAIARAIAKLIPPGQTIILDGGTTCYEVAKALQGSHLNVITNSVPIASLLSVDIATEITLIGGYLYPRTGVALGAMAEQHLDMLQATQLVMSCAGMTHDGAFNANQMMVEAELKMMQAADEVILALDHTKFAKRSVAKLADPDEFDVIVTDSACDDETRNWLESLRAKVIYAELE